MHTRFPVPARPGATGRGYEIVCTFYRRCFPSPHPTKPGLGQGFNVRGLMDESNFWILSFGIYLYFGASILVLCIILCERASPESEI
jgi:hypothetical protein